MPNDACITCDNDSYYSCYVCNIEICTSCCYYLIIWNYTICSSYCMHEYIRLFTQENKYTYNNKHIHYIFDKITDTKKGYEIFDDLINDQDDQLSLIELNNKKKKVWTKMFLLRYMISDLVNIVLEY